jgi:Flp pilus assembly pilin Flp
MSFPAKQPKGMEMIPNKFNIRDQAAPSCVCLCHRHFRQAGQSLTEYAILIALIGVVAISLLKAVGNSSSKSIDSARHALGGKTQVSSGSSHSSSSSSISVTISDGVPTNQLSENGTRQPITENRTSTTNGFTEVIHNTPVNR